MSSYITDYYIDQWEETPEDEKQETLKRLLMIHKGFDDEKACEMIEEYYFGAYTSRENFAADYSSERFNCCEDLERYIDFERMAWDYFVNDFFGLEHGYIVHVFSNQYT